MAQDLLNKKTIEQFGLIGEVFNKYRNPVIGSFIVSWIVFNWKVVLFILLYSDSYSNLSFETFVEQITGLGNWCSFYLFPFLSIIFYVVILPIIGLGVRWFYSWISVISKKIYFNTINEIPISGEEHTNILKKYEDQIKEYTNRVNKYRIEKKEDLQIINDLRKDVSELKDTLMLKNDMYNSEILNGLWIFERHPSKITGEINNIIQIKIENSNIYEKNKDTLNYELKYIIHSFLYNKFDNNNKITFLKELLSEPRDCIFYELNFTEEGDLVGKENIKTYVKFKREKIFKN